MKLLSAMLLPLMLALAPGQHTAWPKYWPQVDRYVTNYTPYELDYRIENLVPDNDAGLWFSTGQSIEHIDRHGRMESFSMPSTYWIVSSIVMHGDKVLFSAGQSGKVGVINRDNELKFTQVVPRRYFPSLRDLVVNRAGEMWFLDVGRKSYGYRSAAGRVVEKPLPENMYPQKMQHCMGRLWVSANALNAQGGKFGVIDNRFKIRWHQLSSYTPADVFVRDMICDRQDRLWLVLAARNATWIARLDREFTPFFGVATPSQIAPASDGGIWITSWYTPRGRATLAHIDGSGHVSSLQLPTENWLDTLADANGTLWLAMNESGSPIAVTRLSRSRW
jgi:hypothetical protein